MKLAVTTRRRTEGSGAPGAGGLAGTAWAAAAAASEECDMSSPWGGVLHLLQQRCLNVGSGPAHGQWVPR
ncbi:hypothetical protein KFL01_04840 [Kocuria flava]|uniref:Secreted protein n=1 Tax=Kocuria flava TaxID=446860 RepID=A0ABQ0X128_9MICC|nr:hypothetical protein KFL01_04840 [Kocuria flava]